MGEKEHERMTEEDKCKVAWEIATNFAMNRCSLTGEKWKKEAFKAIGTILGLEEKEANDVSGKCETILSPGWLTKDICYSFRDIRTYTMCAAWKILEEQRVPFREAMAQAWRQAKEECRKLGAAV